MLSIKNRVKKKKKLTNFKVVIGKKENEIIHRLGACEFSNVIFYVKKYTYGKEDDIILSLSKEWNITVVMKYTVIMT